MKFLWVSDHPAIHTGYGSQTRHHARILRDLGHEVDILARGAVDQWCGMWDGFKCYPKFGHPYGWDLFGDLGAEVGADFVITLHDLTVATPEALVGQAPCRWVPYFPVDAENVSVRQMKLLQAGNMQMGLTMSQWGRDEVEAKIEGPPIKFLPHVVTHEFTPGNKKTARELHPDFRNLPKEATIIGMIAANQSGEHSRKGIVEALISFGMLTHRYPDKPLYLYLHSMRDPVRQNVLDLNPILAGFGIKDKVIFPHAYYYQSGQYTNAHMADLYRSFDFLYSPSHHEGCNVPIIEAHACGIPAVFGNWQGMRDHVTDFDVTLEVEDSEPYWNQVLMTFLQKPKLSPLLDALEEMYERKPLTRDERQELSIKTRDRHSEEAVKQVWAADIIPVMQEQLDAQEETWEEESK